VLTGLCVGAWVWVVLRQFPGMGGWGGADAAEALLLVTAVLATVSTVARQVSLQNALMAAGIIGVIGGTAHWASYVTAIPFGPLRFLHATGTSPVQEWFFVPALLWVAVLLNARGVARALLGPASGRPNQGTHLLWMSALLVVTLAMALEPFASTAHHYWLWGDTRLKVTWHTAPLSCLFGWGAVGIIASFAATPCLIIKHPRPGPPPTDPAWLWAMAGTLFAVGNGANGLWPGTAMAVANVGLAMVALWRNRARTDVGGRRQEARRR